MPTIISNRSRYASRLFYRRPLDLRVRLVALHASSGERLIVHGRTRDVSCSGAGLTITRELPSGSSVMLCLRLPGGGNPLCLRGIITRCRGFRVGLQFLQPTAEQRLLISELCYA